MYLNSLEVSTKKKITLQSSSQYIIHCRFILNIHVWLEKVTDTVTKAFSDLQPKNSCVGYKMATYSLFKWKSGLSSLAYVSPNLQLSIFALLLKFILWLPKLILSPNISLYSKRWYRTIHNKSTTFDSQKHAITYR